MFTGAGSGIGKAACQLFNKYGASVIAADNNFEAADKVVKSLNGQNQSLELEVSSKESVQNGLQSVLSTFKAPPTVIVNAAGILRDNFILKLTEDNFDDVIRINLKVFSPHFITTESFV